MSGRILATTAPQSRTVYTVSQSRNFLRWIRKFGRLGSSVALDKAMAKLNPTQS
uniref:Uncharacterized protein n=1 Tax=Physcomitrium patens TaxID=3218 RepID=A0A2K1KN10_PHYPA|nr:hypothetical protein PHYPA_006058 [Physcomitrium patens]